MGADAWWGLRCAAAESCVEVTGAVPAAGAGGQAFADLSRERRPRMLGHGVGKEGVIVASGLVQRNRRRVMGR